MKLYAQIKLKPYIEKLRRRRGFEGVPLTETAEHLSSRHGVAVTRAYIGWYCRTRGIPTYSPEKKTNPCKHCGEDVQVNSDDRPYDKHRKCELKATLKFVECDSPECEIEFQRSPSAINEISNYCSYSCFNEHRKIKRDQLETSPV